MMFTLQGPIPNGNIVTWLKHIHHIRGVAARGE